MKGGKVWLAFASVLCCASLAGAGQASLFPVRDAYIGSLDTDCSSNRGSMAFVAAGWTCGKLCAPMRALLDFDMSSIPPGAIVTSAILHLYVESQTGPNFWVDINRVTSDWVEQGVTWQYRDCPNGAGWLMTAGGDFTTQGGIVWTTSGAGHQSVDITGLVQDEVILGSSVLRLLLKATVESGQTIHYIEATSREGTLSANRPYVDVTWAPPTATRTITSTPTITPTPTPSATRTLTPTHTSTPTHTPTHTHTPMPTQTAYPCTTSPNWMPIGPAPFAYYNEPLDITLPNAGIVLAITVDPQDSNTIYLGTRDGGVWKTTNRGLTWVPKTENAPSMRVMTIAVHPTQSNVVLAGTGLGARVDYSYSGSVLTKAVGVMRSMNGADDWLQIGPTWCNAGTDAPACFQGGTCVAADPRQCPGTDPTQSTIRVTHILIDNSVSPTRVWAGTEWGLWYSDDALTAPDPGHVTWVRVTTLPYKADGVTPEFVNNIFVSPLDGQVLYASVGASKNGNNGWYRSLDRGDSWDQILQLEDGQNPNRSAIAQNPGSAGDVLYTIVGNVDSAKCGFEASGQPKKKQRIYKMSNSGSNWSMLDLEDADACEGQHCDPDCIQEHLSVQVDPQDPDTIVFGGLQTWRATATDGPLHDVKRVGFAVIHADVKALTFDPNDPNVLLDGNDGGIWAIDFSQNPSDPDITSLHGNLANIEFFRGGLNPLNSVVSAGGTQDNGILKSDASSVWVKLAGGDGAWAIFDPTDANVAYFSLYPWGRVLKTADGGGKVVPKHDGLVAPVDIQAGSLAMDPGDSKTLVVYEYAAAPIEGQPPTFVRQVFRTTTGAEPQGGAHAWTPLGEQFPKGVNIPLLAVAPVATGQSPSNLIYGSACRNGLYRTTDAQTWAKINDPGELPRRCMTGIAFDTSQPCDEDHCTMYASMAEWGDPNVPGCVFKSTDAGQKWDEITVHGPRPLGGTGDWPANSVVLDPNDPGVLYVATDIGVFQGTLRDSTWEWCPFGNGLPAMATVKHLAVDPASGTLRAFTFGRSAWEVQAFPILNPDQKANTTQPATGVFSASVSSTAPAQFYALAWKDDRNGANNWHVYYRAYEVGPDGNPTAVGAEQRVDEPQAHAVGTVSVAAQPGMTAAPYCAWVAWSDDRSGTDQVYYQYTCSDGYKLFTSEAIAGSDTQAKSIRPVVAAKPSAAVAIAWEQEKTAGSFDDIYIRFFDHLGLPVYGQCGVVGELGPCQVNSSGLHARSPAIASDADDNIYVTWSETSSAILIRKYDSTGSPVAEPMRVDNETAGLVRDYPSVAVTDQGLAQCGGERGVIVTWYEQVWSPTGPMTVVQRRFCADSLAPISGEGVTQVDQPPKAPAGLEDAVVPHVATDADGNTVVTWLANASEPSSWNTVVARSFDPQGNTARKDFRVDLAGRGMTVWDVGVARTSQAGTFAYVWTDDSSGRYEVYTRVIESVWPRAPGW